MVEIECFLVAKRSRAAKTSVNNSSHGWLIPGLRWVTGKDCLPGLNLFPLTGGHGRSSSPEKDAEEMEEPSDDYSLGHFSELEAAGRRLKLQWGENGPDRKLQRYRTQRLATHLHRDTTHDPECHTSSERLSHPAVSERPCSPKSVVSHVPLRLQIKVNGQRGGLGICIAGGKGSLPYKENDEGIFISRVSKGGPAEKAGVHVGDRVLEIPRIILTHPSTSDEDVEPLTQGSDDGDFDFDFSDSDSHIYSDCLNSAFYPL
ncbi:protein LAP2-like [Sinocyclocheilus rhinocerous]|uniref:protein LAP2-like n=1 Tax=Sinocyclocheilus rhinocerous TaxID=307959 RepID=UPI0007B7F4A5|nr:PREDICTED: protein LAP2-like [Sinocyclocheilus rhinocerous]